MTIKKQSRSRQFTTRRHPYSIAFREEYGRGLAPEEIRLVQAYRGLDAARGDVLLGVASALVLARAKGTE